MPKSVGQPSIYARFGLVNGTFSVFAGYNTHVSTKTCKYVRVSPSGKALASQANIRGFESHHPL